MGVSISWNPLGLSKTNGIALPLPLPLPLPAERHWRFVYPAGLEYPMDLYCVVLLSVIAANHFSFVVTSAVLSAVSVSIMN
jgi:hypothetical protein